jgi:hypothetical protein
VAAREGDAQGAGPPCERRVPGGQAAARRRRELARHRHEENVQKLIQVAKALPLDVGAALLASSEGYTPRATNALDRAREELGEIKEIANALADNLPAPKAPSRKSRRRKRKKKGGEGQAQTQGQAQAQPAAEGSANGASAGGPEQSAAPKKRRRRRRKPAGASSQAQAADTPTATAEPPAAPTSEGPSMLLLLAIGFVAGIVTALSPCVLPRPPDRARRRCDRTPAVRDRGRDRRQLHRLHALRRWLLDSLGLPQDLLRNLAIVLLFVVAASLLVPQVGRVARAAAPVPDPGGAARTTAAASCSASRSASSSSPAPGRCSRP